MKAFSDKVLALLVLILFLAVLFLSIQAFRINRSDRINEKTTTPEKPFSYAEIDRLIQLGAIDEVSPLIKERLRESDTAGDFLSLAKRAMQIGEISEHFTLLESVGRKGTMELPGREDLATLLAFSLLRQERFEEAEKALRPFGEGTLPFSQAVSSELIWKASIGEDWDMDNPSTCQASVMVDLVRDNSSPLLLIDLIICLLLSGREEEAISFAETLLDEQLYTIRNRETAALLNGFLPTLFSLFADGGMYRKALELLESQDLFTRPEQMLLKADIFLASRRKKEAAQEYEKALEYFPDYSWIPYLNLQIIVETPEVDYLTPALQHFQDNQDFLRNAILFFYSRKEYKKLDPFLSAYKDIEEDSFTSLIEQMTRGNVYPDRYRYQLLRLAESFPDPAPILLHGVWFFYGLRDYASIGQLISSIPTGSGSRAGEIIFAKGVQSALEGKLLEARDHFRTSFATDNTMWEGAYNAAMISRALGNAISLSGELNKALSSVPMEDKKHKSTIYFRMAEHEASYGNREEARKLLSFALDIDPHNPSARSLKSSLDH